jgi:hypothetical protein
MYHGIGLASLYGRIEPYTLVLKRKGRSEPALSESISATATYLQPAIESSAAEMPFSEKE